MARRNPMNQRYKKDAQVGATRKSAASAKPKRSASDVSSSSSSSSSAKKGSSSARTGAIKLPPEIKKLQNIVFICLGVAVLLSLLYLWQGKSLGTFGSIVIGVSYGLLFTALYIDFTKVRPVVKLLRAGGQLPQKPGKPQAEGKSESGTKAESDTKGKDA